MHVNTGDFDYSLPAELIAQTPIESRDRSRLMVLNRSDGSLGHRRFYELPDFLHEGDVLVFNNSRVIPARLAGKKADTGGKVEILLLKQLSPNVWETLVKPGRRVREGTQIEISDGQGVAVSAGVVKEDEGGIRVIKFSDESQLAGLGKIPLPPYIRAPLKDPERYQTVYADVKGSVAAPTAGLHFTPELIEKLRAKGIRCLFVTLHVGLDTFQPLREGSADKHRMHREYGIISREVAEELSRAKKQKRKIVCVGTTSTRLVEAVAQINEPDEVKPFAGWVDLFIVPGHQFRMVDCLITNFHLPRTTLMMLVTAFAGKELITRAYQEAIDRRYFFYSFGDAMLVL